jgi:hypothetical protein
MWLTEPPSSYKASVHSQLNNGEMFRLRVRIQKEYGESATFGYHSLTNGWTSIGNVQAETWYQTKIVYKGSVVDLYLYDSTGSLVHSETDITDFESTGYVNDVIIRGHMSTGGSGNSYQDLVRVRKYVNPEPYISDIGSEESI